MSQDARRREASRRFVSTLNARRSTTLAQLTASGELLTRLQAATTLGVSPSGIDHYIRRGYLAAIVVEDVPGQAARLVRREDLQRLRAEWRRTPDLKRGAIRSLWLDPEFYVRVHRARGTIAREAAQRGLPEDEMEAVYRHRAARRATAYRSRPGRPKGSGPPDYHFEWAEAFQFWMETLHHDFERDSSLISAGDRPPTEADAFLAVAEADFAEHPERWGGYQHAPGDAAALHPKWAKPAVNRVRKAVKSLQIPDTEMP
jgi:hypothetical protein